MKLYYSPAACSLSPHIVAREAGIEVELVKADTKTKKMADGGDYWQVNPKGYVPALALDNGQLLTEGPVIVQYLADLKPGAGLIPAAGTLERYRVQEWLNFITSEIHKSFSPLFNPAAVAEWKEAAKANLAKRFALVGQHLEGKQYLMGDTFTVADAYLFTVANWGQFVGIDIGQWPALKAHHARVAARPKVQEALKAEGLVK
ncbi:MAG: glutathione transferase GstA [Burkholderiales bacterium]|nr:glutathione transferase GstA [Burkholderiales bacterium]